MQRLFFVTGTDTNVGKTYVCVELLKQLKQMGYSTLGIKPIASGCQWQANKLVNDDALALQAASTLKLDYDLINPIKFEPPIAPHIAAHYRGEDISLVDLIAKTQAVLLSPVQIKIIEGAGGWSVPLNHHELFSDYVKFHQFKVIIVVGMRLGCINHAILTYRSILDNQLEVAGWVANYPLPDVTHEADEIEAALKAYIHAPFLGRIKHNLSAELTLDRLFV